MSNTVVIIAVLVVLAAQAATVYAVRHLVRKWCVDVYKSGFKGGRHAEAEASEPLAEAYRLGFDLGYERGAESERSPR